jgi:hypothetical protein
MSDRRNGEEVVTKSTINDSKAFTIINENQSNTMLMRYALYSLSSGNFNKRMNYSYMESLLLIKQQLFLMFWRWITVCKPQDFTVHIVVSRMPLHELSYSSTPTSTNELKTESKSEETNPKRSSSLTCSFPLVEMERIARQSRMSVHKDDSRVSVVEEHPFLHASEYSSWDNYDVYDPNVRMYEDFLNSDQIVQMWQQPWRQPWERFVAERPSPIHSLNVDNKNVWMADAKLIDLESHFLHQSERNTEKLGFVSLAIDNIPTEYKSQAEEHTKRKPKRFTLCAPFLSALIPFTDSNTPSLSGQSPNLSKLYLSVACSFVKQPDHLFIIESDSENFIDFEIDCLGCGTLNEQTSVAEAHVCVGGSSIKSILGPAVPSSLFSKLCHYLNSSHSHSDLVRLIFDYL